MINKLIAEIRKSLDNDCFLSALMIALTLPDICGAIEFPDANTTTRYKKWYSEYIGKYECSSDDMPYASADVIYDLRCSLLHSGNPSVNLTKNNLILFKLWITDGDMLGGVSSQCCNNEERTLELSIRNICFKLCRLAEFYYNDNKDKFRFNYTIEDMRKYEI